MVGGVQQRIRLKSHRLATALGKHRRSQNAWAQRLGLSKGYLSQLVNGRRRYPSADVRRRLLEAVELEFDELFELEPADEPDRAKDAKRSASGPQATARRGSRDSIGDEFMQTLWYDLRHAVRLLTRRPAFSLLAIVVLALGIGANVTAFSVVDSVLLEPLPFPDPEGLVLIDEAHPARGLMRFGVSPANLTDWQTEASSGDRAFAHIAAYLQRNGNLQLDDRAERVSYALASVELFPLFGVPPRLGRTFETQEGQPGGDAHVVLSHDFWRSHFGASETVLGESVMLDGEPHTIIGVMPVGFRFPNAQTQLWKPIALAPLEADNRSGRWLAAIGRLHPGADLQRARTEMRALAGRLATAYPETNDGWDVTLTPLHSAVVSGARSPLLMVWAVTGLMLLVACANIAHLLLARAATRRHELSVRAALGAGRRRLLAQLMTESVLLSLLGGLGGLVVALVGVRLVTTLAAGSLPRVDAIGIDLGVLGFALALSLLTGLLFGLAPASGAMRESVAGAVRDSSSRMTTGGLRQALVVAEVAIALLVVIGTALLIRSFVSVSRVDPGFEPRQLLSARVEPPMRVELDGVDIETAIQRVMARRQQAATFFDRLIEDVEALPGVEAAAAVNYGPLAGDSWFFNFSVAGRPEPADGLLPSGLARVITPGYFETLGIPLLRGRGASHADDQGAPNVVVIDSEMARLYWPGEDPLGQRITMGDVPPEFAEQFTFTVVGVVGEVRHNSLETMARPAAYFPFAQATTGHHGDWGMSLMVRTAGDPLALAGSIRDVIQRHDPSLPVFQVRSMQQAVELSKAGRRLQLQLVGALAMVTLILAAVGIYGVIAYSVSRRTREMGIRLTLGARGGQILQQVLREGMAPVIAGLMLGLAGALALARVLSSFLFGIEPIDAQSFLSGSLILSAVAVLACLIPAWRATRVDPAVVLRHE